MSTRTLPLDHTHCIYIEFMFVFLPFAFGGNPASESGPRAVKAFLESTNAITPQNSLCIEQLPTESALQYLDKVYRTLCPFLKSGKKTVIIGGNHLSVFPVYRYYYTYESAILTLDAHCDCYALDQLNHANFMNSLENQFHTKHMISGVRAKSKIPITPRDIILNDNHRDDLSAFLCGRFPVDFLDIDLDVIDPDIFSWCGSPCDNGLTENELMRIVECCKQSGVKTLAISEYIPNFDFQQKGLQIIGRIIDAFY